MKIGVICPSEIAFRRFVPALKETKLEYAGVAYAAQVEWRGTNADLANEKVKALKFHEAFGGDAFPSYKALIESDVDCVYIPLPPALHKEWGLAALNAGKHVFMEKPFTIDYEDTKKLIDVADKSGLSVHENYAFVYHSQLEFILNKLKEKVLGELRLVRIDFGFPFRGKQDFRYDREMGGGALLDAGGYTLKLASILLGDKTEVVSSHAYYDGGIDLFGSATLRGADGLVCQVSYGMDNEYRCNLDIWGSEGCLFTERILTAPVDYVPKVKIVKKGKSNDYILLAANSFKNSINAFLKSTDCKQQRETNYKAIILQAKLTERCKELCESQN